MLHSMANGHLVRFLVCLLIHEPSPPSEPTWIRLYVVNSASITQQYYKYNLSGIEGMGLLRLQPLSLMALES